MLRRSLRPLAGILISLAFLGLALYRVDLDQIWRAILQADVRFVALAAVSTFLSYVWRTQRWLILLAAQKKIPFTRLYALLVIGFALNNLLPGRPGEFVRAYLLGQRHGVSKTLGLATVMFERVADGLTLAAILVGLSFMTELPVWQKQLEMVAVFVFAAALAGLIFLLAYENLARRIFERILFLLPPQISKRLSRVFGSFILGLRSLKSPGGVALVILLSLLTWVTEASHYFLVLSAFNLLPDISARVIEAGVMMVIVNLGILIPAAPGGIGPFEYAGVLALDASGVRPEIAFSTALVAHGIQYGVVTLQGLVLTAREGIGLTQTVEES